MIGYILNPQTLETEHQVEISTYNLPIETMKAVNGQVVLVGDINFNPHKYVMQIPTLTDRYFKINGAERKDSNLMTTLTISDEADLLGDVFWRSTAEFPSVFKSVFTSNGQNEHELERFAPYYTGLKTEYSSLSTEVRNKLSQITPDSSEYTELTTADGKHRGRCSSLIRTARKYGLSSKIIPKRTDRNSSSLRYSFDLELSVIQTDTAEPIFFNDGHSEVKSEAYNSENIATSIHALYNSTYGMSGRVFYLYEDLTIGTDVRNDIIPSGYSRQMAGYSEYLVTDVTIPSTADANTVVSTLLPYVQEEFSKNAYGHKVEFFSDKVLHLGQPVKLMLNRGILDTTVSQIMLTDSDSRFLYTCGDMPVTATDQITAASWKYGTRLPYNPRKGQLFIQT